MAMKTVLVFFLKGNVAEVKEYLDMTEHTVQVFIK